MNKIIRHVHSKSIESRHVSMYNPSNVAQTTVSAIDDWLPPSLDTQLKLIWLEKKVWTIWN
jgi:hypothetical protein